MFEEAENLKWLQNEKAMAARAYQESRLAGAAVGGVLTGTCENQAQTVAYSMKRHLADRLEQEERTLISRLAILHDLKYRASLLSESDVEVAVKLMEVLRPY